MQTIEESARFLMQSTLGADYQIIIKVSNIGIEKWLDQQLENSLHPEDNYYSKARSLWRGNNGSSGFRKLFLDTYGEGKINGSGNNPALPYKYYFRMAWWHRTLAKGTGRVDTTNDDITQTEVVTAKESDSEDLVRHRIAQALSEILVISDNSVLELDAEGMACFYDLLYKHAFGSYKDLLTEVSMHPCMGVYLTHINNRRGDPVNNIHPDENYAREIMQLFTIGLYQLHPDGSRKVGDNGKGIPTYDNGDITQLARVFTGIKSARYQYEWPSAELGDGKDKITFSSINNQPILLDDNVSKVFKILPYVDMVSPMVMDAEFHDTGAKRLLNGHIQLPAGQTAHADIVHAVSRLVAHPNTAPFIATKLIQQLVTSNPLPAYVQSVAAKFGTSGDLKAAVREILVYPLSNPVTRNDGAAVNGNIEKLKSPTLRVTQLLRAFRANNKSNRMWLIGDDLKQALNHHPLSSPTVFNFYKPDFSPQGPIYAANKVAPEFELLDAHTSISFANMLYDWLFGEALPLVSTTVTRTSPPTIVPLLDAATLLDNDDDKLKLDFTEEIKLASDPEKHEQLIERVSLLLTGKRNLVIKPDIRKAFANYDPADPKHQLWIVQTVVFMVAVSPEFAVLEC